MAATTRTQVLYNSDILAASFLCAEPTAFCAGGNVFGWAAPAGGAGRIAKLPKRLTPRHVVGVSAAGHVRRAIVADPGADLWTAAVAVWTDADGEVITVTGYVGEKVSARVF